MARTIAFDYQQSIHRATRVFWKKGYSNASMRDLLKAMGIGEGSFYNSIGSKQRLYLACLKYYSDTVSRRRLAVLESAPTAKEGIRAFFKSLLDELDDPRTPRVCLLAASMSGDVLAQRELRNAVLQEMRVFGEAFTKRLQTGKDSGELPANFDVDVATSVLLTYLQGMFRVIQVLSTRAEVERQIDALLAGLEL
jgi:TetR/AcrR family transcriptional repressor of nem operon